MGNIFNSQVSIYNFQFVIKKFYVQPHPIIEGGVSLFINVWGTHLEKIKIQKSKLKREVKTKKYKNVIITVHQRSDLSIYNESPPHKRRWKRNINIQKNSFLSARILNN
jgi:hypothetical protein